MKAAAELRCAHPERGIPRPDHADSVDGCRRRPAPESLVKSLAKGQQSTDLSTTERLSPSEFGCPGLAATTHANAGSDARLDRRPSPWMEGTVAAQPPVEGRARKEQKVRKSDDLDGRGTQRGKMTNGVPKHRTVR